MALATAPLTVAMAMALAAAPADASTMSRTDPAGDHVGGQPANLDIAKVSLRTKGKQKIRVTFGLHNDVTADDLAFPSTLGVIFQRDVKVVRAVEITSRGGVLESKICTYDTRKEQFPPPTSCSAVPFTQADGRTFRVDVRRNQVKRGARVLKWYASAFSAVTAAIDPLGPGARKPFAWRL